MESNIYRDRPASNRDVSAIYRGSSAIYKNSSANYRADSQVKGHLCKIQYRNGSASRRDGYGSYDGQL